MRPVPHLLAPNPPFPNSPLPVLVYQVLDPDPDALEKTFRRHGWTAAWRNGIFPYHHWHSTAHEVLGIARGSVSLRLGGPDALLLKATPGTVVVLPAGTAHRNEGSTADLLVVGATAGGRSWDIQRGFAGPDELREMRDLPRPDADPVDGPDGALVRLWR